MQGYRQVIRGPNITPYNQGCGDAHCFSGTLEFPITARLCWVTFWLLQKAHWSALFSDQTDYRRRGFVCDRIAEPPWRTRQKTVLNSFADSIMKEMGNCSQPLFTSCSQNGTKLSALSFWNVEFKKGLSIGYLVCVCTSFVKNQFNNLSSLQTKLLQQSKKLSCLSNFTVIVWFKAI